jgi:hypothetical protein
LSFLPTSRAEQLQQSNSNSHIKVRIPTYNWRRNQPLHSVARGIEKVIAITPSLIMTLNPCFYHPCPSHLWHSILTLFIISVIIFSSSLNLRLTQDLFFTLEYSKSPAKLPFPTSFLRTSRLQPKSLLLNHNYLLWKQITYDEQGLHMVNCGPFLLSSPV